jgi:hypothetical protein
MKHPLGDSDAPWSRPDETAFIEGFEAVNRIPVAFSGLPPAPGDPLGRKDRLPPG